MLSTLLTNAGRGLARQARHNYSYSKNARVAEINARFFGTYCDLDDMHQRLNEHRGVCGVHGGDHAVYHALAELKVGRKLHRAKEGHMQEKTDEWVVPELKAHLNDPRTQANWADIATLDPRGMDSVRPTISATPACMEIPEIMNKMKRDGKIVNDDGSINIIKIAVDPVWHIEGLAKKLGFDEQELRENIRDWTQNETVLDPDMKIFLPSIGGTTVYVAGDLSAIHDPDRELAIRPHDECNGSDVFGTDICTCRPYLVYAIQGAVEAAQAGGCGIIAYYRKEGRALGEVTKFRVYNSRKYQDGGDRPDTYFSQTENIAGIVDARVQELMPDPLRLLGIDTIDRLMSMSKDKYDAITDAGIKVNHRDSLPESMVPKNAQVEISAKIAAGYADFQPEAGSSTGKYLMSLQSVRERAHALHDIGVGGNLPHFHVHMDKIPAVVDTVLDTMSRAYPDMRIPPHSRMRHFETGGFDRLGNLQMDWRAANIDELEATRRAIDLIMVSVLTDAGAGHQWKYQDHISAKGKAFGRSEGLGVASFEMFRQGVFSSDNQQSVDSNALKSITGDDIARGFQVTDSNPLLAVEGRAALLSQLGDVLERNPEIFTRNGVSRPGHLLDHLLTSGDPLEATSIQHLWKAVIEGLGDIFPDATGQGLGDVGIHSSLGSGDDAVVPFHKLSQWLTYSLQEPLESFGLKFWDSFLLTGLPEYRNGGLFVDTGVLVPKDKSILTEEQDVTSETVVEWRGLTVALLDETANQIHNRLGMTQQDLPLAKILEGGTWRAGRELAFAKRPQTGDPPIKIKSTGNVF
eukprot:GFYU01015894.1.p1 GENE.GFYU01015894.1~~GFYU01015894.1.p1  ORF type:complete len:822 (-),score=283.67 GFYU01015894.1:1-2412(-)